MLSAHNNWTPRFLRILAGSLLCLLAPFHVSAQEYVPGTLIVKFAQQLQPVAKTAATTARTGILSIDALNTRFAVQDLSPVFPSNDLSRQNWARRDLALDNIFLITLLDSLQMSEALDAYRSDANVVYAQRNHVYYIDGAHADSLRAQQWALPRINAFEAWEIEHGSREVIVGIIDTGIDYLHEDLAENIWINASEDLNGNGAVDATDYNGIDDDGNGFVDDIQGWDFTDAPFFIDGGDYLTRDNDPADEHGHGTSVAGIVAARGDNEVGITGIAYGCRLMNLRAGTSRGLLEEDDVASALAYAADNGARIVNMSFGDVVSSPLFRDAISYARSRGLILVASAGNSASSAIHYPSGFEGTISVGATDSSDFLAGFSNFGSTIDLVAPGSSIMTTQLSNKYGRAGGTSAAAPFVSGVAALLLSQHPDYSAENVKGILLSSTDDLGSVGWDRYYASGRINAFRALSTSHYTVARILHPRLDQGFGGDIVPIIGTASGVYMESYRLSYGSGVNPETWRDIVHVSHMQVIEDTLGFWDIESLADSCYTLRLSVENFDGTTVFQSVVAFVDRTPPVISEVRQTPIFESDEYAVLFEFSTDDLCLASLYYRAAGSQGEFTELPLHYESTEHRILLTPSLLPLEGEVQIRAKNISHLTSIDNNGGNNYLVSFAAHSLISTNFVVLPYTFAPSFLLNKFIDFDNDLNREIVVNEYSSSYHLDVLKLLEFENANFVTRFASEEPAIPRDVGDSDGDGRYEILAGYGSQSMIFEQSAMEGFSFFVSWRNTNNFWASTYADLDDDGKTEIIARVDNVFQIWENSGDNEYVLIDSLPNPTGGTNITGVPHVETGDFDRDGKKEILIGDYDGDIYLYESFQNDRMRFVWSDSLPLLDTIDFLSSGDYDGDGAKEIVVGCHSDPQLDAEHEFDARYWLYRVYNSPTDDVYEVAAEWRFFGFQSPKDFDSGVSSGDIDGDGVEEILINVFPDFYLIDYDSLAGEYAPVWHYTPNRSNVALVADLNGNGINELYMNDGEAVLGFELLPETGGPATPRNVTAFPLDSSSVHISWDAIEGVDGYLVYYGMSASSLTLTAWTEGTTLTLDSLTAGITYWCAVSAIASSMESQLSAVVSATPNARPRLQSALALSETTLRIRFSEEMNTSVKYPQYYCIQELDGHPSSALFDKSGREVIVTLQETLSPSVPYHLTVNSVYDALNTPIDTANNTVEFSFIPSPEPPYLISGELGADSKTITLSFSQSLEPQSAGRADNYRIEPATTIEEVRIGDQGSGGVIVTVEKLVPLGADGARHILYVENVTNNEGVPIQAGRGDRVAFNLARKNLSRVYTYPNPYSPHSAADGITFANLTPEVTIRIMTLEGIVVRELAEQDGNGGLLWDTKNSYGELVGSGVYLFYIVSADETKMGKLAIVR